MFRQCSRVVGEGILGMSWRHLMNICQLGDCIGIFILFHFIYLFFISFLIDDHVSNFIVWKIDRNLTTIILPFTKLVCRFTKYLSTSAISPLLNRKKIIPLIKSNFCQIFIWLLIFLFIFYLFVSYWFITYLYFNLFSLFISSANYGKKKQLQNFTKEILQPRNHKVTPCKK